MRKRAHVHSLSTSSTESWPTGILRAAKRRSWHTRAPPSSSIIRRKLDAHRTAVYGYILQISYRRTCRCLICVLAASKIG